MNCLKLISLCAAFAVLAGCDAGHLGNPLTLPVRGVIAGVENATYDARRARVKAHLAAHGPSRLTKAAPKLFELAEIPPEHQAKVLREISELTQENWAERATVIAMVHRR